MRTLFVTWDGPQVSYVESLFLPIFEALGSQGFPFDILQFRWGSAAQEQHVRERCTANGIGYVARSIHRGFGGVAPFATAFAGGRAVKAAAERFGSDLIMPRSHMPALATLCARSALPMIFDADGLPADERVEFAGLRPTGLVYRLLRDIEAQSVRRARAVITRSPAAAKILSTRAGPPVDPSKFHVVVNGRDPQHFIAGNDERVAVRAELRLAPDAPLLVYSGSIGPQYRLDLVARLFASVRVLRPDAQLLILTGSPELARRTLEPLGVDLDATRIVQAAATSVPRYLAAADIGLAYRTPSFSMQAVAPVKLAEYLLCGLPVVGTAKVGDTAAAQASGIFLDDDDGGDRAARWVVDTILPSLERMRTVARRIGLDNFSLERSVAQYRTAIESIAQRI